MSRIEVEHQGFKIFYGENSDLWECNDLRLESPILSKLKTKINQHVKNVIKTADLVFGHRDYGSRPVRVQLISRDNASGKFWVVSDDGRRRLAKPEDLTPWDDDTDEAMAAIANIAFQISQLDKQRTEIEKSIRKLTTEEIDALLAEIAKRATADAE